MVALTPKEISMLDRLVEGDKNSDIAIALGVSQNVVKNYFRVLYDKTGMSTRLELAFWWLHFGPTYHK